MKDPVVAPVVTRGLVVLEGSEVAKRAVESTVEVLE